MIEGIDVGQIGIMIAVAGVIIMPVIIIRLAKQLKKVQELKEGKVPGDKVE
ncbi:MAG: hypothetical protein SGJ27_14095 [Candidatus Melainabacteria bacterium]|nr:hypothetical protein [Candidatus Melainabacteria bacterium]